MVPDEISQLSLRVSVGGCTDAGPKQTNQDAFGSQIPKGASLQLKGAVFAVADGISTSPVGDVASETAVASFIEEYYCTSEAWSVAVSGEKVMQAINSRLFQKTQQSPYAGSPDRGYVCTLSVLVIKANFATLFHVGDSRIYRMRGEALEQLTHDHQRREIGGESYLSRALGWMDLVEVDVSRIPVKTGDIFLLATDGLSEFIDSGEVFSLLPALTADLDAAAKQVVEGAVAAGADDNLTVQIVRVESVPEVEKLALLEEVEQLPVPPMLEPPAILDGYRISRELHSNNRSRVYLAIEPETKEPVAIKVPAADICDDKEQLERFFLEEWIARRVLNPHVLKAPVTDRPRRFLYTVTEYIDGQTLAQWAVDHPNPDLETVRGIVEQVAQGLQAIHRKDMVHQDLRPENIMMMTDGTVKIIDFGATRVAGLEETLGVGSMTLPGTALYMAPEYFLGEIGTDRSDQYSLAVLTYFLLSGDYPYGANVARCNTVAAQNRLTYSTVMAPTRAIPSWMDLALKRALHVNPYKRYDALSEFVYDLRHPNSTYVRKDRPPLIERDPVRFWQCVSIALLVIVLCQWWVGG